MIQSIYTSVSNADVVPCGKKGQTIKSDPIPLLRNNYLGEYRTELEKAKVRKNLGIADEATLQWGNIFGFIEQQTDLIDYIKTMQEYSTSLNEDVSNVREALDYIIGFVTTFKTDTDSIQQLKQNVVQINEELNNLDNSIVEVNQGLQNSINILEQSVQQNIDTTSEQINQTIYSIETDLRSNISTNAEAIGEVSKSIEDINQKIEQINQDLIYIDVDSNILGWVQNKLSNSNSIELTETELQVKISSEEKNAIQLNNGLFVHDYSEEISNIQNITNNLEGLGTYQTDLADNAKAPITIGGIVEGTKVSELRNKTISEILDTLIFPTSVRLLEYPQLYYSELPYLVEIGQELLKPILTYYQGDAGETLNQSEQILDPFSSIITEGVYNSIGTYTYKASLTHAAGAYLENNKGEITDIRVEEGIVETEIYVVATYPWYTSFSNGDSPENKQELVAFGISEPIIISLQNYPQIWLPGENSQILSFKADTGLGYLPVDMDGWEQTTKQYNNITYKVWSKKNPYAAIITHEIQFKLAL